MGNRRPNILLYVMDTQRFDNLSCCGYNKLTSPNIDRMTEEGTLFLNNISPCVWTLPSHASIFTGKYQQGHGVGQSYPFMPDNFVTLTKVLRGQGYRTLKLSRLTGWLEPAKDFEESIDPGERQKHACEVAMEWIDRGGVNAAPFFIFINSSEPHMRYWPPQPFRERYLMKGITDEEAEEIQQNPNLFRVGRLNYTKHQWQILKSLYDGETAVMDSKMGLLFDHMEDKGMLNNTVLIITSDHGDVQGEHNDQRCIAHQLCIYDVVIHVPLIVRYPEHFPQGRRVESLVQTLDIFPTIMDILDIGDEEILRELHGHSLLKALDGSPRSFAVCEYQRPIQMFERIMRTDPGFDFRHLNRSLKACRNLEYKYIWSSDGRDELYLISEDRDEQNDLTEDFPEKVAEMKAMLEGFLSSIKRLDHGDGFYPKQGSDMDKVELLKAWGFLREIRPPGG